MPTPAGNFRSKDFGVILVTSALFRVFYYWHLHVSVFGDTSSYIHAKVNLFKGEIDAFRTPVYPWLLRLIAFLGPTRDFVHDVFIIQALLSFASIYFFYRTAGHLLETRTWIVAATLLYGISPTLANFDMCVLTESISIDAMVFFVFLITDYLRRPTRGRAFGITLFVFFLVFLRPGFIYLVGVMALFWIARIFFSRDGFRLASGGLLALALGVLLIIGYKQANHRVNGVNAISAISNLNQLELVAAYGIYPLGGDSALTAIIRDDLQDTTHFFLAVLQRSVRNAHIPPERIDRFINNSISAAPGIFIKKTLARGWTMQFEPVAVIYAQQSDQYSRLANFGMRLDPLNFFCVSIFLSLTALGFVVTFIRARAIPWLPALLWAIATSHYIVIFLGARYDHQRLFVIALPLLILLFFYWISTIVPHLAPSRPQLPEPPRPRNP